MEVVKSRNTKDSAEFLKNLHQFMETSPLGQFETRLSYLYNIHCHLISIEQNGPSSSVLQDFLHPYIWNTFSYYKQFESTVASKLASLRSPIEKKMKDFVKISRWNDANYYALKDSVQKNQKMLTKFVKEWKKAMMIPVSTVLIAELSTVETCDTVWKRRVMMPRTKLYLAHASTGNKIEIDVSIILNVKRLAKLPKLFNRAQKVLKDVIETDSVTFIHEVETLEEVTGTVINDVLELQGLEVTEKSHEKRKKILHNIHFRKRASLADLFKVLQQMNLSYRRGLVQLARDMSQSDKLHRDFYIHPVDIAGGWSHLVDEFGADKHLVKCWEGCELYYQKCLSRMAVMMKSFHSPSKELGPRIIERCKGFVTDLMGSAAMQKEFISSFGASLWTLRNVIGHNYSQGQSITQFQHFYQEASRIEYKTLQFKLLLETLLTSTEFKETLKNVLGKILGYCEQVKIMLKIYVDSVPVPNLRLKLMNGKIDLVESLSTFEKVSKLFRSIQDDTVLGESFGKMASEVEHFVSEANEYLEVLPTIGIFGPENGNLEKFGKTVKLILRNVLLTFQNLEKYKTHRQEVSKSKTSDEAYVTNLKESMSQEMNCFEIGKLVAGMIQLLKIMRRERFTEFDSVFSGLTPILHQYCLMAEFYLTLYIQLHRSTCKLLSVLLRVFATLGSKGFCLPADYEDEAAAEGQEMDASSGMGMGEGETTSDAQDVSDRMESEDQLEDTLKDGESAPSAEKDLNDDEKGVEMSEDFDGKQQEKDRKESGDNDEENESDGDSDSEELDKQMDDVDDTMAEKLDDQMWGGSSDEDDEDLNEKDEEQGKGSNRQSEPELRAKDPTLEKDSDSEQQPPENSNDERNQGKEFNEQENEELNDDQLDPFHGQNIPEQEPEAFDLPDDLNLDGGEPKDKEEGIEENPFDLDNKEKDDITEVPESKETIDDDIENENENENQVSEDEDPEAGKGIDVEKPLFEDDEVEDKEIEEKEPEKTIPEEGATGLEVDEPEKENEEEKNLENVGDVRTESEQKSEDKAEPSTEKESKANDQTTANENAKGDQIQGAMDATEVENSKENDETASGQAESHDGTGHEGKSVKEDKNQALQKQNNQEDALRRPGDTDNKRSLANDPKLTPEVANRLKTLERPDESQDTAEMDQSHEPDEPNHQNAELYQHIKDAEKSDEVTIDNSTKEQAEKQKSSESKEAEEKEAPNPEMESDVEMIENNSVESVDKLKAEKPETNISGIPDKPKSKGDIQLDQKNDQEPMEVEVEGEKVATQGAQRPAESLIETRFDLLEEWSNEKEKVLMVQHQERVEVSHNYLSSEEETASLTQWHELDGKTLHLAQELSEQLRLVLEPTQAARLKGDYKTGKRLNMRKVIPYIASGFRKDKIWLRRTQPSKREYQILLALDDSASMADNQSKQMAFSAVAVVARSLGLLEAGQLGVVGFGEDVQLLHPFEEPFTDLSGAKLIQLFTFTQRATRIAQLLDFTEKLFEQSKESHSISSSLSPEVAQLLLIVSDGRGVSHEGSGLVKKAVRQAREKNIFVVFIIVDNPENKDSILDIRLPIFAKDGSVEIAKYMDHFPFPFYLILRDLSALPRVLSDALRQWFELVTSSER